MPLDFEPYSPGPTQAEAAAALARYRDERTQIASVARVQASLAVLVNIINGCDFPLGSPFPGLEIEQVVGMLQTGGDAWPLHQHELAVVNQQAMAAIWTRIGGRA